MHALGPSASPSWGEVELMAFELAKQVLETDKPDLIVGLETGGCYVAAMLKQILGVPHMVTLDVVHENEGYRLGGHAALSREAVNGLLVLCVNDGLRRGILLNELVIKTRHLGGIPLPAALIRIGDEAGDAGRLDDALTVHHIDRDLDWPWKRIEPLA